MDEFKDKVTIITGAAGTGIGGAVAAAFAKEGARVVVSDSHAKRPFALAEELEKKCGVETLGLKCDVRVKTDVEDMIAATLDKWGRIDILINNAGIDQPVPIWEMSDDVWNLVIDVNLTGCFYCCRAVLPTMIKQNYGKIVNVSSAAAFLGDKDDGAAYVTAKAGVMGLTRAIACQVGEYNINANTIAPGLAFNPFLAKVRPKDYFDKIKDERIIKRDGTPEDMANSVLFLASDKAGFITGACLDVNGGWVLR